MRMRLLGGLLVVCGLCACAAAPKKIDVASLREEVMATERQFARSMADRDHAAFVAMLAEDTVFFSSDRVLRGRDQVAAGWAELFQGPQAPFSWAPEQVEVLESGDLALSTGPVHDPQGRLIATFSSVWRRQPSGEWRIVFDRGNPACPPVTP